MNEDGLIDRTIERTEPENMKQFRYMFAAKAREKLNDGHLYYSIFARPVESHFTRFQRSAESLVFHLDLFISLRRKKPHYLNLKFFVYFRLWSEHSVLLAQ